MQPLFFSDVNRPYNNHEHPKLNLSNQNRNQVSFIEGCSFICVRQLIVKSVIGIVTGMPRRSKRHLYSGNGYTHKGFRPTLLNPNNPSCPT